MLFALAPLTRVRATILPPESAKAVFLAVSIAAFVSATVRPLHKTLASHSLVNPLTGVCPTVEPLVSTVPFDSAILELALVATAV